MAEIGSVQREKYWSELTDTEKIERCRQEIKSLSSNLSSSLRRIEAKIDMLMEHRHLPDGQVVKKIDKYDYLNKDYGAEKATPRIPGQEYF